MERIHDLWDLTVPAYWLPVAWMFNAAAWTIVSLLWAIQMGMAAQRTRWPAMYIHAFKFFWGAEAVAFFVLSLLWRDPGAGETTFGILSRNIVGAGLALALFIEAVWRIKEAVKATARGAVVVDVPYLREGR